MSFILLRNSLYTNFDLMVYCMKYLQNLSWRMGLAANDLYIAVSKGTDVPKTTVDTCRFGVSLGTEKVNFSLLVS